MSIDVVDLRNFYAQRLGVVARRFVGRGIRKRFADTRGMSVLGVGYPTPYLGLFREEAERCLAFMPAVQGVVKWPTDRPGLAALVDELELPLADYAFAARSLVHADWLGRRAACAAGRARLVLALGRCLGARGLGHRRAVRGRAHRRGDKAGLSRRSGAPPARTLGACIGACARAFARWVAVVTGLEPAVPAITKERSDPSRRSRRAGDAISRRA